MIKIFEKEKVINDYYEFISVLFGGFEMKTLVIEQIFLLKIIIIMM